MWGATTTNYPNKYGIIITSEENPYFATLYSQLDPNVSRFLKLEYGFHQREGFSWLLQEEQPAG
jgi:hypothetical protein